MPASESCTLHAGDFGPKITCVDDGRSGKNLKFGASVLEFRFIHIELDSASQRLNWSTSTSRLCPIRNPYIPSV